MAFSQSPVNYAVQYSQELANAYPYLSYFSAIFNSKNASKYKVINGKSVAIPSLKVSGAKATNRDSIDGVFTRAWNNQWQVKELSMDREWSTLIDPLDMVETNEVATIANVTRTFNEQEKVPEQDAYVASTLATAAIANGKADTTALTSANVLDKWDDYLAALTNARIPHDRAVCYVSPATYKLLKQAAGITRFIEITNGIRNVDRNVGKLDGIVIVEVPEDMMKTAYDFTEGWEVDDGAGQINMLFVDVEAIVAPIVYDVSMISAPTAQSKGKYLYYERYFYDVFILNERKAGVFVNYTAA